MNFVMDTSSAGRMTADRPEPSIGLNFAHGFLNAFRTMYAYLLECKLPLQAAYERKRLDGVVGV